MWRLRDYPRLTSEVEEIVTAVDYSEPGYDVGEGGLIIFANWNKRDRSTSRTHWIPEAAKCPKLPGECLSSGVNYGVGCSTIAELIYAKEPVGRAWYERATSDACLLSFSPRWAFSFRSGDSWCWIDCTPEELLEVFVHLGRVFERVCKFDTEWSDEWTTCSECYQAVRTQPDSYSWTPAFSMLGDEYICTSCLEGDVDAYIQRLKDAYTGDGPKEAFKLDEGLLEELGYEKLTEDSFESGYHPGQDDSQQRVMETLLAAKVTDFVFTVADKQQFAVHWDVWVGAEELGAAKNAIKR
jgi:hypothetical protein